MEDTIRKSFIWSIIYLIAEFGFIYIFRFLLDDKLLYVSIIGIIYVIANLFFIKYKRERLFINGIISFITVVILGVLVSNHLKIEEVIAIGVAISVMDFISFTKYGKKTVNAKAMSNVKFMSKMIVYGKGTKDKLYATCGIGDYLYFSIWLNGLSKNITMLIFLGIALFLGNLINKIIILKIYNKENYKGIPATIIPFISTMICYLIIK